MKRMKAGRAQQFSSRARMRMAVKVDQVSSRKACEGCGFLYRVHYRPKLAVDMCDKCFDALAEDKQ